MPFLHQNLSVVEVAALVEAAVILLAILAGIIFNLPAFLRYLRLRNM